MQRSSDAKKVRVRASLTSAKAKVKAHATAAATKRATKKSAKAAARQAERATKMHPDHPPRTSVSLKERKNRSGKRRHMFWDDWLLLGIVGFSTLMIVGALCTNFIDTPREAAEKELSKIADDYYITYMYPRLLGNLDNDPAEMLSKYKDIGVSTTFLRQLLKYNDGEFADSAGVFSAIACNTNRTGVRYFPNEPYGPRDYTTTYVWDCDE